MTTLIDFYIISKYWDKIEKSDALQVITVTATITCIFIDLFILTNLSSLIDIISFYLSGSM